MLAYNIPAQICRESFGFFSWRDFDESLWNEVKNSARLAVKHNGEFAHKLLGFEKDDTLAKAAVQNIKKAMLDKYIDVQPMEASDVEEPDGDNTVMIIAPKIDVFNAEQSRNTLDALAKLVKRTFKGSKVWIHSSYADMPRAIGIQPRKESDVKYGADVNKIALY